MIILKFGGTSVSTTESIQTIGNIIIKEKQNSPIVVVSAIKNVTDSLISLISSTTLLQISILQKIKNFHIVLINQLWSNENDQNKHISYITKILKEISIALKIPTGSTSEFQDRIASYGEIMSSYIITEALKSRKIPAKQVIASDIIVTNDKFGNAEYISSLTVKKIAATLLPIIRKGIVPVITGFIGATREGKVTTLGRGGSDYSASIIGSCVQALEIQVWTDVDGVLTADPRMFKEARTLKKIPYKVAEAFATSGANVLHPKTMKPAIKKGIPIRVLNTFNPSHKGTLIVEKKRLKSYNNNFWGITFKKISSDMSKISLVGEDLNSVLAIEQFTKFIEEYKNIIKIQEHDYYRLCFLLDSEDSESIVKALHKKLIL